MSQLPFGFRTKWDDGREGTYDIQGALVSQLPFGFRTKWDRQRLQPQARGGHQSQLPFGFRTKWDQTQPTGEQPCPRRLNCLSAFERSGTGTDSRTLTELYDDVSIAFRLSNEVGPPRRGRPCGGRRRRLNCLSAFERSGTWSRWRRGRSLRRVSQLPFGFRTKWDSSTRRTSTTDSGSSSQLPFGFRTKWDSIAFSSRFQADFQRSFA